MMRIKHTLLLSVLLLQLRHTEAAMKDSHTKRKPPAHPKPKHTLDVAPPTPTPTPTPTPKSPPSSLISQECRSKNYTRSSCAKVFCPPWQRCINEQCVCKVPYQCPRTGPAACGLDGRSYMTMCHTQALACRYKKPIFSHYAQNGACAVDDCGDNSDEMCCTGCQNGAFHCPSGVCLPQSAVGDQIRDCLGDSVPVKKIIIHQKYNSRTYQNDIALIQLEELANEKECLHPNPAVRPVCLPWSRLQFPPNSTCTISGWGRNKENGVVTVLRWANVSLIANCENLYKERFYDGMMCAGDLEGKVDSCQGDSGGPLVCKDASGVSYVWGIVSWGEKCGEAGYPGVYTEVAHYFEWIRQHTSWPAVTKYNQ
ncbi:Complement factor I [Bagarius yarrelli]|uniref:trypsin n=1 Tax=Bagarius yarrelli TaxID=175774 RepID=A0A556VBN8_BAGYA|nr:Complement factor I [Bagarius yarrelli]